MPPIAQATPRLWHTAGVCRRPIRFPYVLGVLFGLVLTVLTLVTACLAQAASGRPSAGPQQLGNPQYAAWGIVDVTAAPFAADPSGRQDSTAALQKAITYARDHQMVCFLPPGEYLVSDTLQCEQFRPLRSPGRRKGTRDFPCVLVGSRLLEQRPRIKLAPHSPGFGDPGHRKYVVHFYALGTGTEQPLDQLQPNISMNQMLIGIDIVIGEGNRGAVGIRHRAAQGSGVQDCTIDATHGYCGLEGGAGSGGSHANVTVIGGRIGVDLRETQPAPTITGFTLRDQDGVALMCSSRQALTAVGLKIDKNSPGPAIVTQKKWGAHHGQLCLVDSQINFHDVPDATAVRAESSIYMDNVFIKGAKDVLQVGDRDPVATRTTGWTHVARLACGIAEQFKARNYENRMFTFPAPIYIDGRRLPDSRLVRMASDSAPPDTLQSQHLWDSSFPNWESPSVINVRQPPYNAKGDGKSDDTRALQRAIDDSQIVFLPKGRYAVSRTLRLRPNTQLIGLHRCYTWIVPTDDQGGDFMDPRDPQPVIATADDPEARTILTQFGIRTLRDSAAAYCLDWRCGRQSIFRDVNIVMDFRAPPQGPARSLPASRKPTLYDHPIVRVTGSGGGRWYNFHQESSRGHGRNYRHLLVEGTRQPLLMYQCNPEHARSDANMELRDAQNVSVFGVKGEYNQPIVWIRDCDQVRIIGYGGNAAAASGRSLFLVQRTPNFLLANLVDSPRMPQGIPDTFFAGDGVDPTQWFMVIDNPAHGQSASTQPLDRPVLYQRGQVNSTNHAATGKPTLK